MSELYKKGLLYESVSIQPYSPAAGTGLSSHELNQPGTYKDVKDTSVVAMFKVRDKSQEPRAENQEGQVSAGFQLFSMLGKPAPSPSERAGGEVMAGEIFLMAWTTTPWTLPSNLGLTVGPNIEYVLIKTFNPYTHLPVNVILAKNLVSKYFKAEGENGDFENYAEGVKLLPWKILGEFKGKELEGH